MTSTSRANPSRQWTSPLKKSKSIQIKSNRRRGSDEFSSSSVSASAEQMYDWATWRMYHRITTARRTKASVKPLPAGSTSHQDTVSSSRAFRGVSGFPRKMAVICQWETRMFLHKRAVRRLQRRVTLTKESS